MQSNNNAQVKKSNLISKQRVLLFNGTENHQAFPQSTLQVWEVKLTHVHPDKHWCISISMAGSSLETLNKRTRLQTLWITVCWECPHRWCSQVSVITCVYIYVRVGPLTICLGGLSGFSLQSLSEELLLFCQVLLYKAVLTHLLSNLKYIQRKHTPIKVILFTTAGSNKHDKLLISM